MSDMPKEIWAWRGHLVDSYGPLIIRAKEHEMDKPSVKYIRADIHEARVTELLESNNALLERARLAEERARDLERLMDPAF